MTILSCTICRRSKQVTANERQTRQNLRRECRNSIQVRAGTELSGYCSFEAM